MTPPFIQSAITFAAVWWKFALAVLAAVLLSYQVGSCRGYAHGKLAMQAAIDRANTAALQQKARADDLAARQRLTDQRATASLERNLADAVANIPDSVPTARRLARACAQLRSQRVDTASLPQCVGSAGTAQAPASR